MEAHSQHRAAFLELYITLSRALTVRKGERYPDLKEHHTAARKLHGESLTAIIMAWDLYGTKYSSEVASSSADHFADGEEESKCVRSLCLDKIYADPTFSESSKKNLWQYIHGLIRHAQSYAKEAATQDAKEDEELPPPSMAGGGGAFGGFGQSGPERMRVLEDLASTMPASVMRKMQTLSSKYQQDIKDGNITQEDINVPSVLGDVFKTLDTDDVVGVVSNLGQVVEKMQKAQQMPEIQALLRSMGQRPPAAPPAAEAAAEADEKDVEEESPEKDVAEAETKEEAPKKKKKTSNPKKRKKKGKKARASS